MLFLVAGLIVSKTIGTVRGIAYIYDSEVLSYPNEEGIEILLGTANPRIQNFPQLWQVALISLGGNYEKAKA